MANTVWIILAIILFVIGFFIGMMIYVRQSKKHFMHHSPVSRQQMAELLTEMGRKPSAAQLNQMMNHAKNAMKSRAK